MKRKNIIILHTVFWVTSLTSTTLTNIPAFDMYPIGDIIKGFILDVVSFFSLFYSFYFFISGKYLNRRKLTFLVIFGLLFTIIFTVLITYLYIYLIMTKVLTLTGTGFLRAFASYYLQILDTNIMFATAGSLFKVALLWYRSISKQKEIEKQFVANELALLRSQINPQFLFNILYHIKSLIYKTPSKAIYSVEKLSEIMSYMLYESSEDNVFLEKEIEYLMNYLDLQRVRYDNPFFIDFKVTGDYSRIKIPPLIFIPFVENSFKYGVHLSRIPAMRIDLDVREKDMTFMVINYLNGDRRPVLKDGSFGLDNIKRRLDLLFENKYTLESGEMNNERILKLNLSFPM